MTTSNSNQFHKILKNQFGYDSFRPFQEKIISAILNQHDCLTIMPTGGGKSLCFQVPGLAMNGPVIVISPLISLMEDQVHQLQKKGVSACMLSSSLSSKDKNTTIAQISKGNMKFIYLSPEQLQSKSWHLLSKKLTIPLVVVDEAHCISQWGHDFRPAYQNISSWIENLAHRPVIAAFTATATTETSNDIQTSLNLHQPIIFKQNELPTHLQLSLIECPDLIHKTIKLFQILQKHNGQPGIIYTLTRKAAEDVCQLIRNHNIHNQWGKIEFYHGGMTASSRAEIQKKFILNEISIMVATNAFGMGVDKPNVRFVIHFHLPNSIEAYSQEVGRAGRDRSLAWCYLLGYGGDLKINADLVANSPSKKIKLREILKFVQTKICLKKQLANYFSLDFFDHNCNNCSICKEFNITNYDDLQIYEKLLKWCLYTAKKNNLKPSFLLSQNQAALLSILKPKNSTQLKNIIGFGQGWITSCWPLVQSGKIYENIKEKTDDNNTTC